MNIEHLKLFVRVAQTQNISAAGLELALSPAVASSYIGKLETSLGVRLIHRTTRKVSLTEEGLAFLPHAEEVLAQIDAAKASIGVGNDSPAGTLRVAAPASFGRAHIMPLLKHFLMQYPNIKVDLRLSDSMIDMVEGGFDLAIRNAALKDSSLIAKKLAVDSRLVCASPAYLAEFGEPHTPTDLLDHECMHLIGLDVWQFQTKNGIKTIKASGSFRTDNGEVVKDAAVQGLGITISSKWNCYKEIAKGTLVPLLEEYPLVSDTNIWAVYPNSRLLAPKVRAFIDYLAGCYADTPYWE